MLAAAALAAALTGCGSGSTPGTTVDPASVVPASAPVYLGADVRPGGSEGANALAAGRSLTHQANPYTRLLAALRTPGSPALDYGRDVAPWLGPHAGIFFTSTDSAGSLLPLVEAGLLGSSPAGATFPFTTASAQGAIVLDTRDAAKARAFVDQQAARAGAARTSSGGVSYELTPSGIAFGLVDRFAVIGSDSGMRAVIETAHGGASLKAAAGYGRLAAAAPAGALAHLYVNPIQAGAKQPRAGSGVIAALAGSRETNISLVAGASSLDVYVDAGISAAASGTPGGLLASAAEGASAFDTLPSDSWLALGLGNLGQTLGGNVTGLRELAQLASGLSGSGTASTSTLSVGGLLQGLLKPLTVLAGSSAQARADFASWMGSGGVFASGTGLLELKAAVVIESHNPAASRSAVGKLAALLGQAGDTASRVQIPGTEAAVSVAVKGLPLSLDIAAGRDANGAARFVLGLGNASVTEALRPPGTLFSSATRSGASSALGEGINPSLVFAVPTLVALLEGVGLTEEPALARVIPYLRAITTVSGGGHQLGGDVERFKLAIALRPAGG
jgi:hypothetical protein